MGQMKQIKPLLPSLRERKRYLVYEIIGKSVSAGEATRTIRHAVHEFIGVLGTAGAGLMFINKYKNNKGIVRVNHRYVDHVRSALLFITAVGGVKASVRSIGASGILKKAEKKYLEA